MAFYESMFGGAVNTETKIINSTAGNAGITFKFAKCGRVVQLSVSSNISVTQNRDVIYDLPDEYAPLLGATTIAVSNGSLDVNTAGTVVQLSASNKRVSFYTYRAMSTISFSFTYISKN